MSIMNGAQCQVSTRMIVKSGYWLAQSTSPTPSGLSTQFTMPNTGFSIVVFHSSEAAAGMIRNGAMSSVRQTPRPRNLRSTKSAHARPTSTEASTAPTVSITVTSSACQVRELVSTSW
jgi:hypothetical protein